MYSKLSRIPNFYKLSVAQRVRAVHDRGLIDESDFLTLVRGDHTLKVKTADKMIESTRQITLSGFIVEDWLALTLSAAFL